MVEHITGQENIMPAVRVVKVNAAMMMKAVKSKRLQGLVPATLNLDENGKPLVRQTLSQLNN